MSCVLRSSLGHTTEPTTRRRAAEEPSKLHRLDILLSRWKPNPQSHVRVLPISQIFFTFNCVLYDIWSNLRLTCLWSCSHDTGTNSLATRSQLTAAGLIAVWFHTASLSLYLHSCLVTQRGSRSLFRFLLEQLMTDQSDHILSIRYTGTELQYFSI